MWRDSFLVLLLAILILKAEIAWCKVLLSRKPRAALQFYDNIQCYQSGARVLELYGDYGCYCGVGGSGSPVDATDRCCMIHDKCYYNVEINAPRSITEHVMMSTFGHLSIPYTLSCQDGEATCSSEDSALSRGICECDKSAAKCFAEAKSTYDKRLSNVDTGKWCAEESNVTELLLLLGPRTSTTLQSTILEISPQDSTIEASAELEDPHTTLSSFEMLSNSVVYDLNDGVTLGMLQNNGSFVDYGLIPKHDFGKELIDVNPATSIEIGSLLNHITSSVVESSSIPNKWGGPDNSLSVTTDDVLLATGGWDATELKKQDDIETGTKLSLILDDDTAWKPNSQYEAQTQDDKQLRTLESNFLATASQKGSPVSPTKSNRPILSSAILPSENNDDDTTTTDPVSPKYSDRGDVSEEDAVASTGDAWLYAEDTASMSPNDAEGHSIDSNDHRNWTDEYLWLVRLWQLQIPPNSTPYDSFCDRCTANHHLIAIALLLMFYLRIHH